MSSYLKPQSPLYHKKEDAYFYPMTTVDQVVLENGNRLNTELSKYLMIDVESSNEAEPNGVNADTLGGYAADEYMRKSQSLFEVNYSVVGGLTEPENPTQNMIWIQTETPIGRVFFGNSEPNETFMEGDVWIWTGDSSSVAFNSLKIGDAYMNMVYPLSAQQMIGGVLKDVVAKTYKSGAWVQWEYIEVPSIYQEVEYLKSSGTQAIDTGYIQNNNTEYSIDFSSTQTKWQWPMGVLDEDTFGLQWNEGNNQLIAHFGNGIAKTNACVSNVRYKLEYKNGALYIDGTKIDNFAMTQVSETSSVFLFAINNGESSNYSTTTIYRFTISEQGKILHDFVPSYRKEDSVAGFFDLKTGNFHTNIGTGTFIVGGDV